MSTQKKLKRGLADLSHFFAASASPASGSPIPVETKSKSGRLAIEAPEFSDSEPFSKSSLITASVISCSPLFQVSDLINLTEAVKYSFAGIHFVSLTDQNNSFEYRIPGREINYEKISWAQLRPLARPQMRAHFIPPESSSARSLVLFDSGLCRPTNRSLFELLDHCIFAVEPKKKQLMQVYQMMKKAQSTNTGLYCSLFLTGKGAEHSSEFIYERFSEIISHFLGLPLGFLGWMEDRELCIDPDLLKEESDSISVRYMKIHLKELLDQPEPIISL